MRRYNIDNYLIEMSASEAEQLFGLSGSYSAADVKKIWRKMSLQHHPDRGGSTEMMKKVNVAYDLLKRGGTVKKSSEQDKIFCILGRNEQEQSKSCNQTH